MPLLTSTQILLTHTYTIHSAHCVAMDTVSAQTEPLNRVFIGLLVPKKLMVWFGLVWFGFLINGSVLKPGFVGL